MLEPESADVTDCRAAAPPCGLFWRPYRSDVSLALLAGGRSSRMGEDKAFVSFRDGTLLEWMRDRTASLFPHVFAVVRDPARFQGLGIPVINDALTESGSAVGIYSAILAAPTERVICVACDMPFVTPRLLWDLAGGSEGYDAFVPRQGEFVQPLCAVYSKGTLEAFLEFIRSGERRIYDLYPRLKTGYLDIVDDRYGDPEKLFLNANTPAELETARAAVEAGAGERCPWLEPRIRAFMSAAPVPIVSFVGKKKSGKTTVVLGVIKELRSRGYRLAVIKHDAHSFEIDIPGTDSFRFREAGAEVVGISSPEKYAWVAGTEEDRPLGELIRQIREPVDLIVTEGFKQQAAPKIEVSRRGRSTTLVAAEEELIGITSDRSFPDYPVPQFALDDFKGLADLIERCILARV